MSAIATRPKSEPTGLPKVTIEIEEITPEQRRKGEQGTIRKIECAHSWVRGMVDTLIVVFSNVDGDIINTGGSPLELDADVGGKFSFLFGSGNVGIIVGTGTTPVARADINIETQIFGGTTSGRLVYVVPGILTKAAAITGGYRIMLQRTFENDSGGDITINEAAVIILTRSTGGDNVASPMILRDLISPGHLVVNGGAVIVRYLLDWLA